MQSAILASSPPKAGTTRGGLRLSLSQKLGLLIAVIVCIAVGLTVMLQISQRQQSAVEDFRDANLQIASLVAQQISVGVRWKNPETITPTLEGVAVFGGRDRMSVVWGQGLFVCFVLGGRC